MTYKVNQATIDLIKRNEGCVLHTYYDSVGIATVGYGHTGPDVTSGMVITQAQAEALLEADLAKFEDGVDRLLKAPVNYNQYGAMVSLAYNVGLENFERSSVLRLHNEGNSTGAAEDFLMWDKAGGRVLAGLQRRREEEKELYLTPDP